jgi:hypothetical protein
MDGRSQPNYDMLSLVYTGINTVTHIPCTKMLRPDSNNLQENIHHRHRVH